VPPACAGGGVEAASASPTSGINRQNAHTAGNPTPLRSSSPASAPSVMPSHIAVPYSPTTRPRRAGGQIATSQAAPAV
jgi:hypothetical protein